MFVDYICSIGLIVVLCAIMLRALNEGGYTFTLFDWFRLSVFGIVAFTVPLGIAYYVASIW